MTNKKTILAIPLMAIAVIAIGFGMTSNVFAQTTTTTVDQPDGPNDNIQSGDQTTNDAVDTPDTGADSQNDGETNDDHNSATQGSTGDGDGEQKDSTELKK